MRLFLCYCLFQGYQLFKDWVDLICFIITSYDGGQAGPPRRSSSECNTRAESVVPFYNWLPIKPVYVPKFSEMAILVWRTECRTRHFRFLGSFWLYWLYLGWGLGCVQEVEQWQGVTGDGSHAPNTLYLHQPGLNRIWLHINWSLGAVTRVQTAVYSGRAV